MCFVSFSTLKTFKKSKMFPFWCFFGDKKYGKILPQITQFLRPGSKVFNF